MNFDYLALAARNPFGVGGIATPKPRVAPSSQPWALFRNPVGIPNCDKGGIAARIRRYSERSAFTMIEIAISLAVIGFALVAIIGILPAGMSVQKDNRQETIINQDMHVWLEAFRNGSQGLDDLTNYVLAITNMVTRYNANGTIAATTPAFYTPTSSTLVNGAGGQVPFLLTNGTRIIGLLGTPKIIPLPSPRGVPQGFLSNHVVAYVRSLSGPASEKAPQTNSSVQDLALAYRMIVDISPYGTNFFNPLWTNYAAAGTDTNLYNARSNYMRSVWYYQSNLHDLRLIFRWPLAVSDPTKQSRQVYRAMVSGHILNTDDNGYPGGGNSNLYFFEPHTYVKAQ